ncbi:aspartate/glutamate racemase family protein [Leucobacter sp. GX24907]
MSELMYTQSQGYPDAVVPNRPGRTFGGVAIGVLLFGTAGYTLPPGSVENATTFKYPVHYRAIPEATTETVLQPGADEKILNALIEAAQELEAAGCRAIIGGCGYFGNYQPQVRAAVNIPVFMSSLLQLPFILNSIAPEKKVAVLCADATVLPDADALVHAGITDRSRLVISGGKLPEVPEMDLVLTNQGGYNPAQLERELVAAARKLVAEDPSIGAVLMECTLYPAHSRAIAEAVNLPVWDFVTMIDWVESAVVKRPFHGYI